MAFALGLGPGVDGDLYRIGAPTIALLFTLVTAVLLVADLERPERFYFVLTKGNPESWLVKGGWVLTAFGAVTAVVLAAGLSGGAATVGRWLLWPGAVLAALAAAYSAFLFGQAEGRDFWQSPLLAPHLVAQAVVGGAAALGLVGLVAGLPAADLGPLGATLVAGLVAHAAFAGAELYTPHANTHVRLAAETLRRGRLAGPFWGWAAGLGVAAPLALLALGHAALLPAAGAAGLGALLALAGLLVYEHLWVTAGQAVPMS
jgi:formate-dependent nitrite reductase membrane component NrfD